MWQTGSAQGNWHMQCQLINCQHQTDQLQLSTLRSVLLLLYFDKEVSSFWWTYWGCVCTQNIYNIFQSLICHEHIKTSFYTYFKFEVSTAVISPFRNLLVFRSNLHYDNLINDNGNADRSQGAYIYCISKFRLSLTFQYQFFSDGPK